MMLFRPKRSGKRPPVVALVMMLGVWSLWRSAGERWGAIGYLVVAVAVVALIGTVLMAKIALARRDGRGGRVSPLSDRGGDTDPRRRSG